MKAKIQTLILLAVILIHSGCAAAWFGAGAATGVAVDEALEDDNPKVVVVEKDKA